MDLINILTDVLPNLIEEFFIGLILLLTSRSTKSLKEFKEVVTGLLDGNKTLLMDKLQYYHRKYCTELKYISIGEYELVMDTFNSYDALDKDNPTALKIKAEIQALKTHQD